MTPTCHFWFFAATFCLIAWGVALGMLPFAPGAGAIVLLIIAARIALDTGGEG